MRNFFLIFLGLLLLISCNNKKESDSNPISPENQLPVISELKANPQTINVGVYSTITCKAADSDGDQLSYSWKASLGDIMGSGAEVFYTAASCCVGENTITVTVKDGSGGNVSKSVKVVVYP